jgi:hypothetical protein
MKHYAGLDVSFKETSICNVDETGSICGEMMALSHCLKENVTERVRCLT